MSARYEKVKNYYDMKYWNEMQVRNAVIHGWITAEEYKTITGNEYR